MDLSNCFFHTGVSSEFSAFLIISDHFLKPREMTQFYSHRCFSFINKATIVLLVLHKQSHVV